MSDRYQAVVFDVYGTLFDVDSLTGRCEAAAPGKGEELSRLWRSKQLEYSWLRSLMEDYRDFRGVTEEALRHADRRLGLGLSAGEREDLLAAYACLRVFPEVSRVLERLAVTRAAFSNGPLSALRPLLENGGLLPLFDELISVDEAKVFKPSPRAYALVPNILGVSRESILFVSSNTWDISGAGRFGFSTAWVDRKGEVMDELGHQPDYMLKDLCGIEEILG
ncbi:2-haloacid dehalogenase [Melghirimyces profundicolus]|uniref:2-haloacid dehalogenase n=1 Tax=Melghirimyces profundicolus TaxID=1242148 RepID=A0A2T6BCB5_9BACL|nr:haloacid dehalogenase type II [Melghirimyces profundicolus]PTX53715.1 2-haloacid dehalogenase [Melghirimyces profundicolus]